MVDNNATPPTYDTSNIDQIFEHAINFVLAHEGGYSNNKSDHGGETKYGISRLSYPHLDIAHLTIDQAKAIYKRDFWDTQLYKDIKDVNLATKIFDLSVNMGAGEAHILLKRALKSNGYDITENNILDLASLNSINEANPLALLTALRSEAAGYYRKLAAVKLPDQKFLNGWLRRAYA